MKYTKLQTRDNAIKSIADKSSAFLYWIDALGVEYLSYFTELARKKGLSMRVDIVRADLPTITPINKSFYDNWTGKGKYKEEKRVVISSLIAKIPSTSLVNCRS